MKRSAANKEKDMDKAMWVLLDRDGSVIGRSTSRKALQRKADRLDAEYGAVRYVVVLEAR